MTRISIGECVRIYIEKTIVGESGTPKSTIHVGNLQKKAIKIKNGKNII